MEQPGTLETVLIEIGKIFGPLSSRLTSGEVPLLFAELGLGLGETVDPNQPFFATAAEVGELVGELITNIEGLVDAIKAEEYNTAARLKFDLISDTRSLIDAIGDMADQLQSADANALGTNPTALREFAEELPVRLIEFLAINYLSFYRPLVEVLNLLDVVRIEEFEGVPGDPARPAHTRRSFVFSNLPKAIGNPPEHFSKTYGWGTDDLNLGKLLTVLERLLISLNAPAFLEEDIPLLNLGFFELAEATGRTLPGLAFRSRLDMVLDASYTFNLGANRVEVGVDLGTLPRFTLSFYPDGNVDLGAEGTLSGGSLNLAFIAGSALGAPPTVILGENGGSRFEVEEVRIDLTMGLEREEDNKLTGEFGFAFGIAGGRILILLGQGDGFVQDVASGQNISFDFDLRMGYSTESGFFIEGSSGIEIVLPTHLTLGPIILQSITIAAGFTDKAITLGLGADIVAVLGPFVVVVQNIGLSADLSFPDEGGNLGPVDLGVGFKPPNGLGLAVDAGTVKGGGFIGFFPEKGEYNGFAELTVFDQISVKAIVLITTKNPDGSKGFTFLLLISVEFTPIQLGFWLYAQWCGWLDRDQSRHQFRRPGTRRTRQFVGQHPVSGQSGGRGSCSDCQPQPHIPHQSGPVCLWSDGKDWLGDTESGDGRARPDVYFSGADFPYPGRHSENSNA